MDKEIKALYLYIFDWNSEISQLTKNTIFVSCAYPWKGLKHNKSTMDGIIILNSKKGY